MFIRCLPEDRKGNHSDLRRAAENAEPIPAKRARVGSRIDDDLCVILAPETEIG